MRGEHDAVSPGKFSGGIDRTIVSLIGKLIKLLDLECIIRI